MSESQGVDEIFINANVFRRVEMWEDETPTGRRVPRKMGRKTRPTKRNKE